MRNQFRFDDQYCYVLLRRGGKRGTEFIETVMDKLDYALADRFAGTWTPKWNPTAQTFYARANDKSFGYLHRWILGVTDPKVQVDHEDHNGLNNRRDNLSVTDRKGNGFNRRGPEQGSKSGRRNVYWNEREQKWMVWLVYFGRRVYIGYFTDLEVADAAARELRRKVLNGEI